MVNLDVKLWELGTQRLHQGLSETILVNTLTDVREFKKEILIQFVLSFERLRYYFADYRRFIHKHMGEGGSLSKTLYIYYQAAFLKPYQKWVQNPYT